MLDGHCGVDRLVTEAGEISGRIVGATGDLAAQIETVRGQVDRFLVQLRAA